MQRGEVYLADLNPGQGHVQAGTRPVIVFQARKILLAYSTVVIIPLTSRSQYRKLPTVVHLSSENEGLKEDSYALCHQIRVLDQRRLLTKLTKVRASTLSELDRVVCSTLGIDL